VITPPCCLAVVFLFEEREATSESPVVAGWSVCLVEPVDKSLFNEKPGLEDALGVELIGGRDVLAFADEETVGANSRDDEAASLFRALVRVVCDVSFPGLALPI
jgi:hypothetical protein